MTAYSLSPFPRACVIASVLLFVIACSFVWAYRQAGAGLAGLEGAAGEILLEQGVALENAGNDAEARAAYERALAADFVGVQNRAFALKQLGALLVRQGEYEAALPYLEESLTLRGHPISAYKPYLEALLALGKLDETERVALVLREMAEQRAHALELARAYFYAGKVALARGDQDAALAAFEDGAAAFPGRVNALEAARLRHERGEYALAYEQLKQAFLHGLEAAQIEEALALYDQIAARYAP